MCTRWGKAQQQFEARLAADDQLRARCVTIDYPNLATDPIASVQSLYKHFGLVLAPATIKLMEQYLRNRPQHKHGMHNYALADYGLTKGVVDQAFGL